MSHAMNDPQSQTGPRNGVGSREFVRLRSLTFVCVAQAGMALVMGVIGTVDSGTVIPACYFSFSTFVGAWLLRDKPNAAGQPTPGEKRTISMSTEKEQTSEELYGISKQPAETCPIIDEALRELGEIERRIRGYEKADESELRDMLSDVETRIGYLDGWNRTGLLEDIRKNTKAIRAWGQEWKDYAKENAPVPEAEVLG